MGVNRFFVLGQIDAIAAIAGHIGVLPLRPEWELGQCRVGGRCSLPELAGIESPDTPSISRSIMNLRTVSSRP